MFGHTHCGGSCLADELSTGIALAHVRHILLAEATHSSLTLTDFIANLVLLCVYVCMHRVGSAISIGLPM